MKTVLCFGDSNTWGAMPMSHRDDIRRFGPAVRWPGVLRERLGAGWHVVEEGLGGRTIARDDPVEGADRNALRLVRGIVESHRPLDHALLMLGTNDLKVRFGATPAQVADGLHALIDAIEVARLPGMPATRVLVICPPPVAEVGCLAPIFVGAAAKAAQLAPLYAQAAASRGVDFFDAGAVARVSAVEGIHLDAEAHRSIGESLARRLSPD